MPSQTIQAIPPRVKIWAAGVVLQRKVGASGISGHSVPPGHGLIFTVGAVVRNARLAWCKQHPEEGQALSQNTEPSPTHRITESQNGRGWKGPLWVI